MRAVAFGLAVVLLQTSAPQTAPPKVLMRVLPRYFAAGALDPVLTPEGSFESELVLDRSGRIDKVSISKPLPDHSEFDTETIRALKTWKFSAGLKDGATVPCLVHVTIEFKKRSGPSRGGAAGRAVVVPTLSIEGAVDEFAQGAYRVGEPGLTTPRQVGKSVAPQYTDAARKRKVQGAVELEGVVQPDGTMGPVRVNVPLDPDLDIEAMRVVKLWQFIAAQKDGHPVPVVITVMIDFRLH